MKIVTVVGARPQFIKAAAVSRKLRGISEEILIHTGQHYDQNMSDVFFEELKIPRPDYNLQAGSGTHGVQTAKMLVGIEEILLTEKPNAILVYGDTNSTLSGALAASKLNIPVMHVEAGLRSFHKRMPEEQNRILTDHLSELLFCPTAAAVTHLANEGIVQGVFQVGDVMNDALQYYLKEVELLPDVYFKERLRPVYQSGRPGTSWYLATIHRAENTGTVVKIKEILQAFNRLNHTVIFSVHPRTRPLVEEAVNGCRFENICFVEPMGYLDMLYFTKNAVKVITDSGGLQKEAYLMQTPCVTVREQTEWMETLLGNCNVLAKPERQDLYEKICLCAPDWSFKKDYYGSGDAADQICGRIKKHLNKQA